MSELADNSKHLQCMEVWGGNRAVESGVTLPGMDAWIFSRPLGGLRGGDVHYVSSCATGQIARVLVADVAGHGQGVASTAAQLRRLMRRYVNQHDQRRLVRKLNESFARLAVDGVFATAVALTFDAPLYRLQVSNAGHPPPLLFRHATQQWAYLDRATERPERVSTAGTISDLPLGVLDHVDYGQHELRLHVGDMVLCYTDSLPESHDAGGRMLGLEGLLDAVQNLPAAAGFEAFTESLRHWADRLVAAGQDDVTALVLRPNGLRDHIPLKDYLLAPFRVARAVAGSYLSGDADAFEPA